MFVAALLTHCLSPHPQPPMSMGSYATSVPAAIAALPSGNKIKNLLSTATKLMTKDMNEVDMPGETSKGSRYRKTYHRYKSVIAMSNL